jgi:hypothetical protein
MCCDYKSETVRTNVAYLLWTVNYYLCVAAILCSSTATCMGVAICWLPFLKLHVAAILIILLCSHFVYTYPAISFVWSIWSWPKTGPKRPKTEYRKTEKTEGNMGSILGWPKFSMTEKTGPSKPNRPNARADRGQIYGCAVPWYAWAEVDPTAWHKFYFLF